MLKADLIGLTEIEGDHGGANISATFLKVLDRYNIREKVSSQLLLCDLRGSWKLQLGWVTGDNVGVNDKAIRCIAQSPGVNRPDRPWVAKQRRAR